ncbi:MAG: DEAD/DEAH box helicase family protein [Chlorobium sp.]
MELNRSSEHPPEFVLLQEENARLKALLTLHNIPWEEPVLLETPLLSPEVSSPSISQRSASEKVALFRSFFRGRSDVYPLRWESAKGKSGYAPACGNEWRTGVCQKPRIKCGDCSNRQLLPLDEQVIYRHLEGRHTVGIFPMLEDDTCCFLVADFDDDGWREDAVAFMQSCREFTIPVALEISRSGNGAHIWFFFADPVPAREARQLGASLISHTCERTRQLSMGSYDRFIPLQDTLLKGGFGNLIALPLQGEPRKKGFTVFVDENLLPYPDQWEYLASIQKISRIELEATLLSVSGGRHPLDIAFIAEEDETEPWKRSLQHTSAISGPLPESLTLVLGNQIFIAKADLPRALANSMIRLAAFQNPEFYKAQAMRRSVWEIPRVIGCAENFALHIGLPRGCLDAVTGLLKQHNIRVTIQEERITGSEITVKFAGALRNDQQTAVNAMLNHEVGILSAPTAFGKTVMAAAIIARRQFSTLILVHRTELLRQWQERLSTFLDLSGISLGLIGGGKKKPTGTIDIAVMQSLSRRDDLAELLDRYGQIIVDECHHLSAVSFEAILKQAKAKYVLGLTATPIRRDGHQPIIFMQCGPVRYRALQAENAPVRLEVWPLNMLAPPIPPESAIQELFWILAHDAARNQRIAEDILVAYREGRKILVLTERTEQLQLLRDNLGEHLTNIFLLHGRLTKKQRSSTLSELNELDGSAPRIILATGRLIGEGFDHPPLDTMVLAMPISWKGTLQQYAGRLHREHASKQDVRIYDYIEHDNVQLARMWQKRYHGYQAMGYQVRPRQVKLQPS